MTPGSAVSAPGAEKEGRARSCLAGTFPALNQNDTISIIIPVRNREIAVPRILIADDDPLLCELLRFKLEAAGHEVQIVGDGEAALDAAQSDTPDVLVLDSMMPILTGPEVLRELKSRPESASLPVIMLTARKGQSDIMDALRAGAADYLTKPFLPDELAAPIELTLARRNGSGTQAHAR